MGVGMAEKMAGSIWLRVSLSVALLLGVVFYVPIYSMDSEEFASLRRYEHCINPAACTCCVASGLFYCCRAGCGTPKAVMCGLCIAVCAGFVCKFKLEDFMERRVCRSARAYVRQLERSSFAMLSDGELYGQLRCIDSFQCQLDEVGEWLGSWEKVRHNPVFKYEREQCDRQREDIQFYLSRRSCRSGCCW